MLQKKGYIPKGNIKKGLGGKSKKSYPKKGTFPFTKPRHLPYGPNFKGFSAATQPGDAAIMAFIFCTSVRLMPSTGLRLGHVLRALAQGIYPDLSSAPPAALRGRRGSPWATPAQEVAASGPGGGCCSFAKTALCCGLEIGGAFPVKLLERAVGGPTLRLSYEHVTI